MSSNGNAAVFSMRNGSSLICFCLIFICAVNFALTASAATFCVSNSSELQEFLNTAAANSEDDSIQIVQGTYNGNFIYASGEANNLTVGGGYAEGCMAQTIDPQNTVLDGGKADHVLVLVSQASAKISVEGLTFQNGKTETAEYGGGLYVKTSGQVILTNNIFSDNTANFGGGGVYIDGASSSNILTNNTFTRNTVEGIGEVHGGGAYMTGPSKLSYNIFNDNSVKSNKISACGGGLYVSGSYCIVSNNDFLSNSASGGYSEGYGGGAFIGNGSYNTFENNQFVGNTAEGTYGDGFGGGLYLGYYQTHNTIKKNTFINNNTTSGLWDGLSLGGGFYGGGNLNGNSFIGNSATDGRSEGYGGGAYVIDAVLTNNVFFGNLAQKGGGAYVRDTSLTNNTLTGNSALNEGGGLFGYFPDETEKAQIYNNIIWHNDGKKGSDLFIDNRVSDDPFFNVPVELFNNDFDKGESGTFIEIPFDIDSSNLANEDPHFVSTDNFRLLSSSPCINSGNNNAPNIPEEDKDGLPRILESIVDMGAYEYEATPTTPPQPPILTVTTNGLNVSCSWSKSAYASGYKFFYAPSPYTGPSSIAEIDMGDQTIFSADLWEGATYFVAVQAYNIYGGSPFSNIELFEIGRDSDLPPDPTNLMICESGSTTEFDSLDINLCWSPSTKNDVKDYIVDVIPTSTITADTPDGVRVRHVENIRGCTWTYTYTDNKADNGGTAEDELTFRLWAVDQYGQVSDGYAEISVSNP